MKVVTKTVYALLTISVAISMLAVPAAFAETSLLAEWLVSGAAVSTNLSLEMNGSILLEDTETIAGAAAVLCKGTLYGTIAPNGSGEITEANGAECVTEKLCAAGTEASPINVSAVGLPWKTTLFLMENGEILELITGTEVGYTVLCLILGVNSEDKCTATDLEVPIVNEGGTGMAEVPSESTASPNTTCTASGKATGKIQADELETLTLLEGGTLTVSSE
jgi:hypothetical protein